MTRLFAKHNLTIINEVGVYIVIASILFHCAIASAAGTVVAPASLSDISESFVQICKELAQYPGPVYLLDQNECRMCQVLTINANHSLKDAAWPVPDYHQDTKNLRQFYVLWPLNSIRSRRKRCGLPELKKTYDAIINRFQSGWQQRDSLQQDWLLFVKNVSASMQQEERFVKSMLAFFSVSKSVEYERSTSGKIYLLIKESDFELVQKKLELKFDKA